MDTLARAKLRAAGGKVMFPGDESRSGVAEAYLGNGKAKFGSIKWKEEYDSYLLDCECSVCLGLNVNERKAHFGKNRPKGLC